MIFIRALCLSMLLFVLTVNRGCERNEITTSVSLTQNSFEFKLPVSNNLRQINLVSEADDYAPASLSRACGVAFNKNGDVCLCSKGKGQATIYDANGIALKSAIGIPFNGDPTGGAPSGVVYNSTSSFVIPSSGEKSEFIFANENGSIVAWNSGSVAITVADRSASNAVYKGITIARQDNKGFLYAADFRNGRIDVYDEHFMYQKNYSFTDPEMPAGYAPFNIREIDGKLYVTYAKQSGPENMNDDPGSGHGYVNIFNTDGSFVKRFASQGTLNSPWGIEKIPGSEYGILIGNFGNGKINVFDKNGNFIMYLKSRGRPIQIEGLCAIIFPKKNLPLTDRKRLYFSAGAYAECDNLFGYLSSDRAR